MKFFLLLLLVAVGFSKSDFYTVIASNDQEKVVALEKKLASLSESNDQQAYWGAIQMKSSYFLKTPAEKLKKFKSGHQLLEKIIAQHPNNAEYRFLRLIIQENAPKVVKYSANIAEDAAFIKKNIATVTTEVKKEMVAYAKISENLNL